MSTRYLKTYKKFMARCASRRDRETVARLVKECCIIDQDFESATFYRQRQRDNAPRPVCARWYPEALCPACDMVMRLTDAHTLTCCGIEYELPELTLHKTTETNDRLSTPAPAPIDMPSWAPRNTPAHRLQIGRITLIESRAPGDAEAEVQRLLMEQEAETKAHRATSANAAPHSERACER